MTRRTILICTALVGLVVGPAAWSQKASKAELRLQEAHRKETIDGDLKSAIDLYRKAITEAGGNRTVAANAMLRLGGCYEKQGNAEARRTYERLVKEFGDQKDAARDAQARLAALGQTTVSGDKTMTAQLIAQGRNLWLGGRITPDGGLIPFIDQTGDVAVRDLRTGVVRRLTNEGKGLFGDVARGFNPIPSRDGKRIAFDWQDSERELRVINVDGTGMRMAPLKRNSGDWFSLIDWSLDGKSILVRAFTRQPYFYGLATVDVTSGELRQIPKSEGARGDFAGYSPDGRYVVYSRAIDDADWDIFALDIQTGHETQLVSGAGADRSPVWVPAGDAIVFRSDRNGKNAIWMVRVREGQANGSPVLIKPDAGDYEAKGISRDGSLFYGLWHYSEDIYQANVDPQTLRVEGAPTRLIETYLGHNSYPVWAPTGDSFAYTSERDKVSRLMVHHRNGSETVIPEPVNWAEWTHWCGTGDHLTSWATPQYNQFQLFDARTGAASPAQTIDRLNSPYQVGFAQDCSAVFVATYSHQTKRRRIYRYEVSSGKETDILNDGGEWVWRPKASPDGRWLVLRGKLEGGVETGTLLISTAGGPLQMLVPQGVGYTWAPDSKRLLFTRIVKQPGGQGEENELGWVNIEGGAPQSIGIRMPYAWAPSLNPDGKRILFSASVEVSNELWVLRNLPIHTDRKAEPVPANKVPMPELITKGRSADFTGRVTADGRLLTFVDPATGDISVRDLSSGEVRRLTHEGSGESPIPSRDGRQVAYAWHRSDRQTELRVVPLEGGAPRTVPVRPHAEIIPADWSPDGKSLIALWRESDSGWRGMATVDLLTGELKRLVSCGSPNCAGPRDIRVGGFSPEGRWIVYSRPVTAKNFWLHNLYVVDRQTGEEAVLLKEQSRSVQPMWIPDSDKVLFQSQRNGKNGIWMLRLQSGYASGAPVLVRHDVSETDWKGISRDGTLFYGERSSGSYVYQATIDLQTMRLISTPTKVSDARPGEAHRPSWSPSGDLWAYLVMRGEGQGSTYAMAIRLPGGKEVQVPHDAEPRYLPRWCEADGRAFVYRKTETFGLRYDARSGAEVPAIPDLLNRQPKGAGLTWGYTFSHDCKRVYISSFTPETSRRRIVSHDLTTGQEVLLLDEPGNFSQGIYISPDGRWLASVGQVPGEGMGILAIPTGGGPLRMLAQVGLGEAAVTSGNIWAGTAVWRGISWTPDSKRVLFPHSDEIGKEVEIFWASIDGGGRQPTGISMRDATAPSIHPDGKRILFSAADDTEELWVLRNLPLN